MIPAKLHRVWVGTSPIPAESEQWWQRFGELNPGWELTTWTELDAEGFELSRLFPSCSSPAQLSDLIRIEIVWREGGMYVDTDVEPIRPLESVRDHELVIATEPQGWCVINSVFGATPHHPALRAMMDELLRCDVVPQGVPPNKSTGPEFFNRVLEGRTDYTELPPTTFYPYAYDQRPKRPQPDTLVVHHWAATWVPEPSRWRRLGAPIVRPVRRYLRISKRQLLRRSG